MTNNIKNNVATMHNKNIISKNNPTNSPAIASLCLGFFAVILSSYKSISLILSLLGLTFGIIAIIKKQGIISILGTIFSFIALIISIIILFFMTQLTTSTITDNVFNQTLFNEIKTAYKNNIKLSKQEQEKLNYINEMNRFLDEMVVAIDNFNFLTNYINWGNKANGVLITIQDIIEDINYLKVPDCFYQIHENILNQATNLYSGATLIKRGLIESNANLISKGRYIINDRKTKILSSKIDLTLQKI